MTAPTHDLTIPDVDAWVRDGHQVTLTLADETVHATLTCPGEGVCQSQTICPACQGVRTVVAGPFAQPPTYRDQPCESCCGTGVEPGVCHLTQWAEAMDAMELHHGDGDLTGVRFPAAVIWCYGYADEGPQWRVDGATYPDQDRP